eukprot:CAMPEP_0168729102 /NCGR_PEP_ID=MMETSP0724-20121128/6024_1 /TAXON_ID=265536 /ORGANISM="Amphiprora sp., Strain CCMP467" /LENGTH=514 /DNA_ID=CAMNT_0008775963 /DNA_START=1492 /DNA_END=3036 /DNA_ORIENTATION=-
MTLLPFLDTRHHAESSCSAQAEDLMPRSACQPISIKVDPSATTEVGQTLMEQNTSPSRRTTSGFNYPPLTVDGPGNGNSSAMTRSTSDCSAQSFGSSSSRRRVIFPHYQNLDPTSPQLEANNPKTLGNSASSSMESISSREQDNPAADLTISSPAMRSSKGQRLIFPPAPQQKMLSEGNASQAVPLTSILKSSPKFGKAAPSKMAAPPREVVDKIPSVESDIPSLATTASQSSLDDMATVQDATARARATEKPGKTSRSLSAPVMDTEEKRISFDPRVWVREFTRVPDEDDATWYSSKDLESFKREAIQLIMDCSETELVPTGTGRFVPRKVVPQGKAFFSHRALRMEREEDIVQSEKIAESISNKQALKAREIRRILIVDPHDICIKLFAKSFKSVLPHVETVGVSSGEEALLRCKSVSFDIVLVEERLRLFHHQSRPNSIASGASLVRELKSKNKEALFIGVSTRLREDAPKLKAGGTDLCWPKPPPKIDSAVSDTLLRLLLERRKRSDIRR